MMNSFHKKLLTIVLTVSVILGISIVVYAEELPRSDVPDVIVTYDDVYNEFSHAIDTLSDYHRELEPQILRQYLLLNDCAEMLNASVNRSSQELFPQVPITLFAPPTVGQDYFIIGLRNVDDEQLKEAILAYTGIERDKVEFISFCIDPEFIKYVEDMYENSAKADAMISEMRANGEEIENDFEYNINDSATTLTIGSMIRITRLGTTIGYATLGHPDTYGSGFFTAGHGAVILNDRITDMDSMIGSVVRVSWSNRADVVSSGRKTITSTPSTYGSVLEAIYAYRAGNQRRAVVERV